MFLIFHMRGPGVCGVGGVCVSGWTLTKIGGCAEKTFMELSRRIWALSLLLCLSLTVGVCAFAVEGDECVCPKITCDPTCEVEQEMIFYSEKCAGGGKVKSCSKPKCVKREEAPAQCANKTPHDEKGVASSSVTGAAIATQGAAATPAAEVGVPIGRVQFTEGNVEKILNSTQKVTLNVGDEIREGDRVATGNDGRAQIHFNSGNILNVTSNSEVVIADASDSLPNQDKKRMLLELIRGRIRNKVNQKYDGKESYYRVKSRGAVAGVRGTDFTVTHMPDDQKRTEEFRVETSEGRVELSNVDFSKKTVVGKGEAASFVSPRAELFSDEEKAKLHDKGYLTPVYKMSSEQLATLEASTNFSRLNVGKVQSPSDIKGEDLPICASPSGKLDQCSWVCENNPGGEKSCRTDLKDVFCVRRICNANGIWSAPTRLPSSYSDKCVSDKPIVKTCDY